MKSFLMVVLAYVVVGLFFSFLCKPRKEHREKIDYTISIKGGMVTVRDVENDKVVGRDVLDSLSVIIVNDNK